MKKLVLSGSAAIAVLFAGCQLAYSATCDITGAYSHCTGPGCALTGGRPLQIQQGSSSYWLTGERGLVPAYTSDDRYAVIAWKTYATPSRSCHALRFGHAGMTWFR